MITIPRWRREYRKRNHRKSQIICYLKTSNNTKELYKEDIKTRIRNARYDLENLRIFKIELYHLPRIWGYMASAFSQQWSKDLRHERLINKTTSSKHNKEYWKEKKINWTQNYKTEYQWLIVRKQPRIKGGTVHITPKWKWARHGARLIDSRWTEKYTEWEPRTESRTGED